MRRLALLLLPLAIMLAGCGVAQKAADKAAEKAIEKATGVSVDEKNNSVTVKGQDGQQVTVQSSDAKLPAGFPLKVHPGGKVTTGTSMNANNKQSWVVGISFDGDPKAVADFYEKELQAKGLKVDRMVSEADGTTAIVLSGASDKMTTFTTITWSAANKGEIAILMGDK